MPLIAAAGVLIAAAVVDSLSTTAGMIFLLRGAAVACISIIHIQPVKSVAAFQRAFQFRAQGERKKRLQPALQVLALNRD